jgi:AcrR family transcriptional regulator
LQEESAELRRILERCLAAFVDAGTFGLSLDGLASEAGISKRMLIHYFGHREMIEEGAMALLEDRLRGQFSPGAFPRGAAPEVVVGALWDRTATPGARGVLLLVMDLSRRAWRGSERAKAFYAEQQKLWVRLLLRYLPDRATVDDVLQSFQGAVLAYLITGDPAPGRRTLMRIVAKSRRPRRRRA